MIDACVNMIARNSEDFIKVCLESVLPYVKRAIVTLDSRSSDNTGDIIMKLKKKWSNLESYTFNIQNPISDLVTMRNYQLRHIKEKYVWIVDSDEYWPKEVMEKIQLGEEIAYGFRPIAVWDEYTAHHATSRRATMRIFKYHPEIKWGGTFGKEKLTLGPINLCQEYRILPFRYIHFTHLKSDRWRLEMNQKRLADDKTLDILSDEISNLIKQIYVEKEDL